ncbi:hypothetical protein [Umezawaea tangerina]|uniref:Uncharacterized protein n=1 Tax=Umezawaea tangerina TaxID=84725 RepID=A0A2T0SPL4_9PSEU|nr:hypothetical protein [Umezawaea tangerina]PRY35348.1 hypothetical protein CLV43_114266 [Umezawaea tangerina]
MHGLGNCFDIGLGAPPAATNGLVTGKRVHLNNAMGVTVVLVGGVASGGDDLQVDLQQHTAGTGGNTSDLDCITEYWLKSAVAMDNSETWTRFTQAAASEIAVPASANTDIQQNLLVFEVEAASLADGCEWISVNVPDLGAGDKTLAVLYFMRDLQVSRTPANLAALLS